MFDKNQPHWSFWILLAIIALIFVTNQLAITDLTESVETDRRTIDVRGESSITTSPDRAEMYFGYEVQKETAEEATQDSASVIDSIRNALVQEGLEREDIETSYYNVYPVRHWDEEEEVYEIVAYKVTHMLKVTTQNLDSVGDYVDAASGAGSNRFDSVSFGLTDERQAELRNNVIHLAARTAKDKALSIASGLGVALGSVRSSSESFNYYPYRFAESMAVAGEAPAPKTEITPGEIEVSATVSVSYDIA